MPCVRSFNTPPGISNRTFFSSSFFSFSPFSFFLYIFYLKATITLWCCVDFEESKFSQQQQQQQCWTECLRRMLITRPPCQHFKQHLRRNASDTEISDESVSSQGVGWRCDLPVVVVFSPFFSFFFLHATVGLSEIPQQLQPETSIESESRPADFLSVVAQQVIGSSRDPTVVAHFQFWRAKSETGKNLCS